MAPKRLAERCRIVLLSAEGHNHEQIAAALGITRQKASRWRARFVESGRAGLENDAPGRGRKAVYGAPMQALIVEKLCALVRRRPRSGVSVLWPKRWT